MHRTYRRPIASASRTAWTLLPILLVFSAGGYSFSDFVRVGIPLTLLMWVAFALLLPTLYGLW